MALLDISGPLSDRVIGVLTMVMDDGGGVRARRLVGVKAVAAEISVSNSSPAPSFRSFQRGGKILYGYSAHGCLRYVGFSNWHTH